MSKRTDMDTAEQFLRAAEAMAATGASVVHIVELIRAHLSSIESKESAAGQEPQQKVSGEKGKFDDAEIGAHLAPDTAPPAPMPEEPNPDDYEIMWRREWDGDDSDLNNFVYANTREELDEHGPWEKFYSEVYVNALVSLLAQREEKIKVAAKVRAEQATEILKLLAQGRELEHLNEVQADNVRKLRERAEATERGRELPAMSKDIVFRLEERARIRRQIETRKSVQEGKPDRIAGLLEEAAHEIKSLRAFKAGVDEALNSGGGSYRP